MKLFYGLCFIVVLITLAICIVTNLTSLLLLVLYTIMIYVACDLGLDLDKNNP